MYLFDTFKGIPVGQVASQEDLNKTLQINELFYEECFDSVSASFAPYPNVHLVRGEVPYTLPGANVDRVSFLHIDMNIVFPEVEALRFFWPKLSPGAVVIFDDYGWKSHRSQREAIDVCGEELGFIVLELPTGQGMLIR
jgi:hypothetical protein